MLVESSSVAWNKADSLLLNSSYQATFYRFKVVRGRSVSASSFAKFKTSIVDHTTARSTRPSLWRRNCPCMAASTSTVRILFVPQITNQTSQKDHELQNAEVLGHAARYSHRKNQAKRAERSKEKLSYGRTMESTRLPSIEGFLAMRPKTANVVQDQPPSSMVLSPIGGILGQSKLDPFDTGAVLGLPPMVFEFLEFGQFVSYIQSRPQ